MFIQLIRCTFLRAVLVMAALFICVAISGCGVKGKLYFAQEEEELKHK